MDRLLLWLAQGCGLGHVPKAPGTAGTLGGIPLTALLLWPGNFWMYLVGCIVLIPIAARVCEHAERILGEKDPPSVVLDEIIALPICFLGIFALMEFTGPSQPNLVAISQIPNWGAWAAAGFLLFRLFDIWKPGPIHTIQTLPNGWGVVLDDVLAGAVVCAILTVAFQII